MPQKVTLLAGLTTMLVAAPALAQPAVDDELPTTHADTVVVVTPQQPRVATASPAQTPPSVPLAPSKVPPINGPLVPIGEHDDYVYDHGKKVNVASNPIGWMTGFYGLSVSVAVHPNVVIRGDANLFEFDDRSGHELGISVPIYFRRAFQGPFLEPGIVARNFGSRSCGGCDGLDDWNGDAAEGAGPELMVGWHWSDGNGFNVAIAVGAMRNVRVPYDTQPAGYFRVGFVF